MPERLGGSKSVLNFQSPSFPSHSPVICPSDPPLQRISLGRVLPPLAHAHREIKHIGIHRHTHREKGREHIGIHRHTEVHGYHVSSITCPTGHNMAVVYEHLPITYARVWKEEVDMSVRGRSDGG